MASDRYRSLGLTLCSLGTEHELVLSEFTRGRAVLPPAEVDALLACTGFRTVEEHSRDGGATPEQVERWARTGLLVSRREVLERGRGPDPSPPPPVSTLGVCTFNRPECLEPCLDGFARNARAYGRAPRIVVLDDSSSPDMRDRNRAVLAKLKAATGSRVLYGGPDDKRNFLRQLTEKGGFGPELLEFALFDPERCGYTEGANRNAMFLETLGELIVTVDNDMLCRLAVPPGAKDGLSLTSNTDPSEFWFHPDRPTAFARAQYVERDFLAAQEELLGRSLSSCLAAAGESADIDALDARMLRTIQSGRGRVRITQAGYLGDSGMSNPSWLLSRTGATRERLTADEGAYRSASQSRNQLRAVRQSTLAHGSYFMTGASGFDNRELLPPFIPVLRNVDGALSVTMRQCFPTSLIGHLPLAVAHDPSEPRTYSPDSLWKSASRVGMLDVLISCMAMIDLGPAKPEGADRLRALGAHLAELGSLPLADFEWILRNVLWLRGGASIAHLEGLLERYGSSPAFWAHDVRRSQEALRQALQRDDYIVPFDLLKDRPPSEARELSRRIVLRFGRLLEAWPDIVAAAKDLRSLGLSLAKEI